MRDSESESKDIAEKNERFTVRENEQPQPQQRKKEPVKATEKKATSVPKESKGRRTTKARTGKSGSGHHQRPTSSAQEYFPFPIVDDRDPEDADAENGDADFQELSSQSESSQRYAMRRGGRDDGSRTRTITTSSRTPVASVVMRENEDELNGMRNGSRIRNAVARDGGRTQSGGVRGIVATAPAEGSNDLLS